MRELHVVALSDDGRHVVLATRAGTTAGEFRVALDERLLAAVRGELPAPGRDAPPSISPRDIQARLRDGQAPEEIAASAGVPLSRVERYAGPVLAELERVVTGARAAVVTRPRLGASALPLGEAVEAHLAEVANLAEGSVRWSARRTDLGRWVVEVSWTARGRRRTAGWHYDPATREVVAVDGPSAVLGHVEDETATTAGRSTRPSAAAVRGGSRGGGTAGSTRSSAPPASAGRSVRSPATPAAGTATAGPSRPAAGPSAPATRAGAAARTGAPRPTSPRTTPAAGTPAPTSAPPARRRATATPSPAAAAPPARRRPATPPATAAGAPTPTPAARTSPRGAPARGAPVDPSPTGGSAGTGRPQPRRTVARRSAVPPVEELAGPSSGTAAPRTASPQGRPAVPTGSTSEVPTSHPGAAPGPPVLRVVPPAGVEPVRDAPDAQEHAPPVEDRPARRAAGQRAGGRDWADVLMGGAPAPPAAGPRQD